MPQATGTFEVETVPIADDATPGRMSISKRFNGDLVGSGVGQMLTAVTPTEGSMAYVAVERVTGALAGKQGSFTFIHRGVMERGASELLVSVVPDSGAEDLTRIAGTMAIDITEGEHRYTFDYTRDG